MRRSGQTLPKSASRRSSIGFLEARSSSGMEAFVKGSGVYYADPGDNMWRWTSRVSRRVFFTRIAQLCAVCTTGVVVLGGSKTYGQDFAPLYTPKTPIPKDPYKTWSLFLINNPQWVVAESNDKVKRLYDQFQAFGRAIGRYNVAVWFWSQDNLQD